MNNLITLYGVKHKILPATAFDYHTAKKLDETKDRHPLGTIYKRGMFGYVANGHQWYQFLMYYLPSINNHPDAGI